MLISMPTDTSTILGVFRAILALLGEKTGRIVTRADVDQASAADLTLHFVIGRETVPAKGSCSRVIKAVAR
jgi:hypothetical protein